VSHDSVMIPRPEDLVANGHQGAGARRAPGAETGECTENATVPADCCIFTFEHVASRSLTRESLAPDFPDRDHHRARPRSPAGRGSPGISISAMTLDELVTPIAL
jgi:hypothetical protein